MGETEAFEEYIKIARNPRFVSVSRQTTTRDFMNYFNGYRAKLVESFSWAGITCVCITSDIWSSNAKEDYLSVVGLLLTTLTLISN